MTEDSTKALGTVIRIDDERIQDHLKHVVRGSVVEAHIAETFSFYAFPDQHWIKLKTNNPLERIMREIRRRTHVVGAFPDGQSALNLAAARLRHIAGSRWSTKRYMNTELLKQQRMTA